MNIKEKLIGKAEKLLLTALSISEPEKGVFRSIFSVNVDGEIKPLFVVGYVSKTIEDGSCIAVLNPDKELLEQLEAGVGYSGAIAKEIVSKKCDAMVQIWVDAYKENGVSLLSSYQSKSPASAKFNVK